MFDGIVRGLLGVVRVLGLMHQDSKDNHREVMHELQQLRRVLMATQQEVDALKTQVDTLVAGQDALDTKVTDLSADAAEIKSDLDDLVAKVNAPSVDITGLQASVASLADKQAAFTAKLGTLGEALHTDAGEWTPTPPAGGTPTV